MNEDQKWFCFENGSYTNESPLPTFDRTARHRGKNDRKVDQKSKESK
jgi:hypothetical protein